MTGVCGLQTCQCRVLETGADLELTTAVGNASVISADCTERETRWGVAAGNN